MIKLTNAGFGAIEALLILVAVGIIGGTGFYVYKSNQTAEDSLTSVSTNAPEEAQANSDESAEDDSQLLTIKEYGVELPTIAESLKGLRYSIQQGNDANGDGATTITLTTNRIDSVECQNDDSDSNRGFGQDIFVYQDAAQAERSSEFGGADRIKQIGDTYFVLGVTTGYGNCILLPADSDALNVFKQESLAAFRELTLS